MYIPASFVSDDGIYMHESNNSSLCSITDKYIMIMVWTCEYLNKATTK